MFAIMFTLMISISKTFSRQTEQSQPVFLVTVKFAGEYFGMQCDWLVYRIVTHFKYLHQLEPFLFEIVI